MRKKNKDLNAYDLLIRYFIILILGLGNLFLFYKLFTPLTIYPVFFILDLFYAVELSGIRITIGQFELYSIDIVRACVAGAAYYLLFALNLATPMKPKKRFYSLLYLFSALLLLNIVRIIVLAFLFVNNSASFEFTHKFLWYGISTIFVVLLWFSAIKIFSIKEIPLYSDIKVLIKQINKPLKKVSK